MALTDIGLASRRQRSRRVGVPQTFTMATEIVRPGGSVANIGVHGKSVDLALNELWIRNIDISMGLVNTNTLGMLLKLVVEKKKLPG